MDPFQTTPPLQPGLPPMRLVNRRTLEHVGPCPFCGGDPRRSDRFHVWLEPGKERFWCRACDAKGPLSKLLGDQRPRPRAIARPQRRAAAPAPVAADTARYRDLYRAVALWAHELLRDPANPDPLAYLRRRGLDDTTIRHALLGVTLRDPDALPELLRRDHPDLLSFAEAAGLLTREHGRLCAHPNLCGAILFPYLAAGEVIDLRVRSYPGKGYRSLPGGYAERGALLPFGWNVSGDTETVILTEGEFKALAVQQAYREGRLSAPALAHPGLSYLRPEWGAQLLAQGVRTVILAYDSQPRPTRDGAPQLAPEEIWSLRHGQTLQAAGLSVRVLRLPLDGGAAKADLDEFILAHGPARLQHLLDTAPGLADYAHSLPQGLLTQAKLARPHTYPARRARPQRLAAPARAADPADSAIPLAQARAQIAALVQAHAAGGMGFLVLAHPPGAGKGHNTVAGLNAYLQSHPTPGQIVWTALRKEQLHDQTGLNLTPLHGRNLGNCRKLAEAQTLAARGYSVRETLCQRRCPFVDRCVYLAQFRQEADFFAAQPLLQATGWWQQAGVVVLDEFDPARLTRIVALDSADLARMRQHTADPAAQAALGWLGQLLGATLDRRLTGGLLIRELVEAARSAGGDLDVCLEAALAALPDDEEIARLPGLPSGASLADYERLPPNQLATLLTQLAAERRRYLAGAAFTSRLELHGGRLWLYLRVEHLIAQLARPEQPKIILDATVNAPLLQAIFPGTPLRIAQPRIAGAPRVRQVITRDWAKSTLRQGRRAAWYDAVAAQIRPDRPTLIVCTLDCEEGLRAALRERGHPAAVVAHYGAIRGSNAYKGYDVILAQVYHPNLDAIVREGRALFAGDAQPLDEQVITTDRPLSDAGGATWVMQVPTFADARLAALLEQRREAELTQAALRGRPFDHPEAQITLLFGLPLPQLPPTTVEDAAGTPTSNAGREQGTRDRLAETAAGLIDGGRRLLSVEDLAEATGASVVTVRKHLPALAGRLGLRLIQQRRVVALPRGGERAYTRWVLVRRGRWTPPAAGRSGGEDVAPPTITGGSTDPPDGGGGGGMDQARNMGSATRLIHHRRPPTHFSRTNHPPRTSRRRARLRLCVIPPGDHRDRCS